MVSFTDLGLSDPGLRLEIQEAINTVIKSNLFILGHEVKEFEYEFAWYCNLGHCVTVANGTDALELSLRALDVDGIAVLVPVNTFAATAMAVVRAGGSPVFVDCDPEYYLMDPRQLSDYSYAKVCIPVHLYGQMAPMARIRAALGSDSTIIEDAAQAHGSTYTVEKNGNTYVYDIGMLGDVAATSFYPTKNLGCLGDGGGVLTDNFDIADRVKSLRNYGSTTKYIHNTVGFNSRLDEIQAAVLNIKLKYLDKWNEQRIQAASVYDELLGNLVTIPKVLPGNKHVYHLYVVQVDERDLLLDRFKANSIEAMVHYPTPLHLQPAFSSGYKLGDFPNAERISKRIISLPMFPGITVEQQELVAKCIRDHYESL